MMARRKDASAPERGQDVVRQPAQVINLETRGLPEPPLPRDSYVGQRYMPLYEEFLTSPIWLQPKPLPKVAAMQLWMASWKGRPACSLPNNEEWLRKVAGVADKRTWDSIRELVMSNYVLHRDNRFYHMKQVGWAEHFLTRRASRKGKGKGDQEAPVEQDSCDAPAVVLERTGNPTASLHSVTANNNDLAAKGAPNDPGYRDSELKEDSETTSLALRAPLTAQAQLAASGASAPGPQDAKMQVWGEGRLMLQRFTGKEAAQARPIMGKWAKEMQDDYVALLHILRDVEAMNPVGAFEGAVTARIKVWQERNSILPAKQRGAAAATAAPKAPKGAAGMLAALVQSQKGI